MNNARLEALKALRQVEKGAPVQEVLEKGQLEGDERRLVSDLVYGVLRTRLRLNLELGRFLLKIDQLPKALQAIMQLGAYELLFQDRAQTYATVNETVKLAKKMFGQKMANVANAALRRLAERDEAAVNKADPAYWAMPEAIAGRWRKVYGADVALALMRRSFQRPWPCLRVNLKHPAGSEIYGQLKQMPHAVATGWAGIAFPPGKLPREIMCQPLNHWLAAGAISHQAGASQLILRELGIDPAWRDAPIWDACAGVGGKTFALLERSFSVLLASDTSAARQAQLRHDCARLRLQEPFLVAANALQPPFASWHGHILIDAPCSGLGVLARRPDIKERFSQRNMSVFLESQKRILLSASSLLKPRRELAYITCTLNPAENEGQISGVLEAMPTLVKVAEWQTPHDHPWLEGMYGCRLRKMGG